MLAVLSKKATKTRHFGAILMRLHKDLMIRLLTVFLSLAANHHQDICSDCINAAVF